MPLMKRESSGQILTAVFVDYDNVYLSLKRKNEEAAKRFSKDAGTWLKEIASGALMTATNSPTLEANSIGEVGSLGRAEISARCWPETRFASASRRAVWKKGNWMTTAFSN